MKPRTSSHAKRDAEVAAKRASLKAKLASGELKKCDSCGPQPFAAFGTNSKTGELLRRCKPCNVKKLKKTAAYNKTDAAKEHKKRYKQTDSGKAAAKRYREGDFGQAAEKRYKSGDAGKAAEKRSNESEAGKEAKTRYKQTDAGKAAEKRYKSGDSGKEADKRYREGDAGQATAHRFADNRQERRRESSAMRMDHAIMCASEGLISGRRETSPTFVERTSFKSAAEFLEGIEETFAPGMTFANHGTVWEVDHKIPREAYDFDNPVDIKRCWSAKNVHAVTSAANHEKYWQLVDQYIAEAGVENFPVAWQGKFPDEAFKLAHAAKVMAQKMIEEDESDQPSGSNDFGGLFDAPDSVEEDESNQPSGSNDFGPLEAPDSD